VAADPAIAEAQTIVERAQLGVDAQLMAFLGSLRLPGRRGRRRLEST